MRLAGNAGPKITAIWAPSHTFSQLISSQLRHVSTIGKKQQYLLHVSGLTNMVNFSPLGAEIVLLVWGTPATFWFSYCSNIAQRKLTKLCTMSGRILGWYTIYKHFFGGSCPVTESCQVQHLLCIQDLHSPILAALLHGTPVVGVSQSLWRLTKGITYIRQGGHHVGHWPTF